MWFNLLNGYKILKKLACMVYFCIFEFDDAEEVKATDLNILIVKLQNIDNDFVKLCLDIINFINLKCYK